MDDMWNGDETYDDEEPAWDADADPAESDEVDTEPCPKCGADVYEESEQCPVCGEYITFSTSALSGKPVFWWVAAGMAALLTYLWFLVYL